MRGPAVLSYGGRFVTGLRIAYFSNYSPRKLGTGEGRIVAFAAAARARGHSCTLFSLRPVHPEVAAALEAAGAVWAPLEDLKSAPFRAGRRLAKSFDVIQLNMIPPRSSLAFAAYAAYPATVLFVDRVSGPPGPPESARPLPMRLLDRATMLRVHGVAGITDYVRDRAQRRFGLRPSRMMTLYNGVDVQRFRPPQVEPSDARPLHIVTVAALIPDKGVDVLVRAVAGSDELGDYRLTIVGDGPSRSALEALVRELGIAGQTNFLGVRDDVPEFIADADIFVHPAVWNEALGNTVLEGMACARCVVASRVGGIPELVRDGVDGILFEAGNVSELSGILNEVAQDPSRRRRLGQSARERVLERFTIEDSVAAHLDWCEASART